jgi:hypothetical protein
LLSPVCLPQTDFFDCLTVMPIDIHVLRKKPSIKQSSTTYAYSGARYISMRLYCAMSGVKFRNVLNTGKNTSPLGRTERAGGLEEDGQATPADSPKVTITGRRRSSRLLLREGHELLGIIR